MPDDQIEELSEAVRENRGWFIALGVLLIIIGIIAIAYPLSATVTLKIFIGWMILIGGIAQVAHAFSTRSWGGFFWDLLIGLLYVFIGAWLAFFPLTGIITLTVMLALMFALEGIMKLLLGFTLRPADGWLWVVLSGLVGVVVGGLLISGLPGTAAWAIGMLVGVNFLFSGLSFIAITMLAKKV
jgi:uncharacterized membrane protein HdeD (DUF308 family)